MSDSLQKGNNSSIQNWQGRSQSNYAFESENPGGNGLDPKKIVAIILRYKWLILFFLVTGATGAWFYAETVTPLYESKGTLLISSSDASANDELSNIISQATGYGTSSTFENELQVLKSREFSRQIASDLVTEEQGDINEFPILWAEEENGEIYRFGQEVVASRIMNNLDFQKATKESDVVEIRFTSSSPQEAAKIVNMAMELYVDNSTQQNRRAAASTAEFLEKEKQEIKEKLAESEENLRSYMDATGIVQVDEQASGMVTRRTEIETELQRVNLELQTIEQSISNYEQQLERIKPGLSDQFSEAVGPRIRNSQEELARYENERTMIIAKNPDVRERESIPPRVKFLDEQIERLKGEIKNLSDKLFTENDEFMGMDGENRAEMISNIQNRLVELRMQQNQLSSRRDALAERQQEMDSNFNSLPEGMIELAKLKRDVRINEELYLNVSRQHADMSIWRQSQFGFGRIIDPADKPAFPVSPNKKILLLLGLMLGGVISAGFIIVKEFMDNSVRDVGQLKSIYPPTLTFSVIPTFEKVSKNGRKSFEVGTGMIPDEMILLQDPSNLVSESIRRLKNKIIYQYGDAPPKTIAVTSPEKGDGKSTIIANLGIAFAEEGYKTLLIDADFRRPKLHKYFGLVDKAGLSDYLNGDLPFQKLMMLIQNTELSRLKVLPAGKETERGEIIGSSKAFKEFLKQMKDVFDVILLDTPPFGIISDSASLLKGAEVTLVVARHKKTNKEMLLRTIEELGQINANVTDIVLNDFDYRKEAGYSYGSGYYQALYSNYEAYL
jgi:capsular exopolysaccharide synthesis family protein